MASHSTSQYSNTSHNTKTKTSPGHLLTNLSLFSAPITCSMANKYATPILEPRSISRLPEQEASICRQSLQILQRPQNILQIISDIQTPTQSCAHTSECTTCLQTSRADPTPLQRPTSQTKTKRDSNCTFR